MAYSKILQKYKVTDDAELEFRFQVRNRDIFKKLISSITGEKTIEQSINFISSGLDTNRICQLYFVNGIKKNSSYMSKSVLDRTVEVDGIMPFKLVLSKEKTIPKFDINLSKFARIKLRLSVRPVEIDGWRIDFTLVRTVNNIKVDLKKDKNKMLYKMNVDDFLQDSPWDYASSCEMEVEHIGNTKNIKSDDIDSVTDYLFGIIDPGYKNLFEYQKITHQIASFIVDSKYLEQFRQKRGIRDLYNRVFELNKKEYYKNVFPKIRDFYLLDKADGTRTIGRIEGDTLSLLNGGVVKFPLKESHKSVTIFDSEYIEHSGMYYVFDVLVYNGENLTRTPTSNRLKYINKVVELSEGNVVAKTVVSLTDNYKEEISLMWKNAQQSSQYEVDGMIFTPKNESYKPMRSWKWKPLGHMSIDFLVKEAPSNLIGVNPYITKPGHTMMFLFSGIGKEFYDKLRLTPISCYSKMFPHQKMYKYFPIQFSPSDNPFAYIYYHPNDSKLSKKDVLDNVCEFRRLDSGTDYERWDIMRVRTDRKMELDRGNYFGNGFYIAEYTWQNYQNPLKFEDLIISSTEFMDMGYFQENKSDIYKPVTNFNSFVKSKLLGRFRGSDWLVDLAAGRGQDMFRVSDEKIKNALFLDNDAQALSELISRKLDFQKGITRLNTRIYTKLVDLSNESSTIIKSIQNIGVPVGSVDVVMCNFAIHYLIGNPKNVRNLIQLVNTILIQGGNFFFTAFNGKKIFDLLKNKDAWDVREGEVLKYSIKKKYTSENIESTGQQIDVLLPFSAGKYYTEYLVNYDYILKEFSKNGFIIEDKGDFGSFLPNAKKDAGRIFKKLSDGDIEFLSLYSYAIVRKKITNRSEPSISKNTIGRDEEQDDAECNVDEMTKDIIDACPTKPSIITDATAGVGSNTISFAKSFEKVNAVEINELTCATLGKNVKSHKFKNVNVLCESYVEIKNELVQDVVFIDGCANMKKDKTMLLDDEPVYKIINEIDNKPELIALKCPKNFDAEMLKKNILYTKVSRKDYAKFFMLFIKL